MRASNRDRRRQDGQLAGDSHVSADPAGDNVVGSGQHCATTTSPSNSRITETSFCAARFTLRVKDGLPAAWITPVTSVDVAAGKLVSDHYTVFLNPNGSLAVTTGSPRPSRRRVRP